MVYVLFGTILPFFSIYLLPSLLKVFSFSLSNLFFFCSRGVGSAEAKIDLIFSGLPSFLNFFLLLRIKILSCKFLMLTSGTAERVWQTWHLPDQSLTETHN